MATLLPGWSVVGVDRHYYIYHNGFVLSVACGYAYHDPSLPTLFLPSCRNLALQPY